MDPDAFSCKKGDFIAVFPNLDEDPMQRRFWIARVQVDIANTSQPSHEYSVIYFVDCDDTYTSFTTEKKNNKVLSVQIEYSQMLGRVMPQRVDSRSGKLHITAMERDRLTALGKASDRRQAEQRGKEKDIEVV